MKNLLASTPSAPYYAVIFSSMRTDGENGYHAMAEEMLQLAKQQPGFLGFESARETIGITVSYWQTLADISAWKQVTEHLQAQHLGKEMWYKYFYTRICKVERDYHFEKQE